MATIISTKTSGVGGLSVTGDASGILQLASADGTTALTIDASQNVGIGTSSPAGAKLRLNQPSGVYGPSTPLQSWAYANVQVTNLQMDGSVNPVWNTDPDSTWAQTATMIWQYRGSEKMRIDSSGNVGIGVVPNVWSVGKAIEIGSAGNSILGASAGNFQLYSNLYYNGGSKFATAASTFGSSFQMVNDSTYSYFAFNTTSVAGTAGNTATMLERMRIDSAGNVGIGTGTTIPNNKLTVGALNTLVGNVCVASFSGANVIASNTSGMVVITSTDSIAANIGGSIGFAANGTVAGYPTGSIAGRRENATAGDYSSYMQFTTSSSNGSVQEKMRIDSSGALILVGSAAQKATGTTWSNPSDIRLKDNVTEYAKGLNELMQVSVKEWEYNGKGGTPEGLKGLGVIADEVMLILPNTVENYKAKLNTDDEEDSDIKKFDATEITWLMLKSIQELKAIIDTQNARIEALEAK